MLVCSVASWYIQCSAALLLTACHSIQPHPVIFTLFLVYLTFSWYILRPLPYVSGVIGARCSLLISLSVVYSILFWYTPPHPNIFNLNLLGSFSPWYILPHLARFGLSLVYLASPSWYI